MEPTAAAWGRHLEFQLAMTTNWQWPGAEEAPAADGAQVWAAPAGGLPLEYASIVDIFGSSCSLQPYNYVVPASISSSAGQQQVVDFNYYAAAAQQLHDMTVEGTAPQEDPLEPYVNNPKKAKKLFKKKKDKFDAAYNADFLKMKMHRYPASIRALDKDHLYTKPRVVAIGPYHHYDGEHLKQAEEVKHAAAWHCMEKSDLDDVRVLYHAVVSAVVENDVRRLYDDEDVMTGITEDEFLPMMFYDACFLVMYMLKGSGLECDRVLADFFESNKDSIAHDIMLLENQIPWPVVEAVMNKFESFPLESMVKFIARWKVKWLQDRALAELPHVVWDEGYKPPHLLGLLRFYMVGEISSIGSSEFKVSGSNQEKIKKMKISAGAIELAEMGIQLTADETRGLPDMGLARKCIFFAELSMAPLCLNDLRASQLVNMAALEACTTPDFFGKAAEFEDSAVCSYLLLLGMLMHREADVHQLRTEGILQGAGLTNNKTLDLFTSLHCLPEGRCYAHVMAQIEAYRVTRCPGWLWVYRFIYRNLDYMIKLTTVISVLYGLYKFFDLIISAHLHHH
ncbi:hypothetical protein HU200_009280 [Digitaria exilis]|uniref:Uncharacterized protein n=1 Tax=Digitaria exilis TaxID=1010633 RepID=A0A835FLJ7_9POAL|nr:hypothetical protein HU200_009280 [Digitaria exilis]